jgi:hypothetical protein
MRSQTLRLVARFTAKRKDLLSQESIRMIQIGADYVIDGSDPDTVSRLQNDVTKSPEIVISFAHPSDNDIELLACLGGPKVFAAKERDLDVASIIRDNSAIGLLGSILRDEQFEVAFPAKIVGAGLETVSKSLEDVPQEMVKSKHVVLL